MEDVRQPTRWLSRLLEPLAENTTTAFWTARPISLVSENVFRASDAILVPMIPTTLSARTLDQLLRFFEEHGRLGELRVLPLFTMVDRRKRLYLDIIERLAEDYPDLLATHIPDALDVERMGIHRQPLLAYAPSGIAAGAYRAVRAQAVDRGGR